MEFNQVVRRRRMIRHYKPDPLSPELVDKILNYALRAPSGGFTQGWGFLALTDEADRKRFWQYVPTRRKATPTMQDAPLVVVPLSHKRAYLERYAEADKGWEDRAEERWPVPYWHIDTGMATLMMLLGAVDEGLDACLFGIMSDDDDVVADDHTAAFRAEFGIPDEYTPIGAITVGYRADDTPAPNKVAIEERRKRFEDVVRFGQWS